MMDRCVWTHAASPYLPLLRQAGCEAGDLRVLVQDSGLEPALQKLRDDGVYFTFEEFKGRKPVERGSVSISLDQGDFDNPHVRRLITTTTTGSTGQRTQVWSNLDALKEWRFLTAVANKAHGFDESYPTATWTRSTWRGLLHVTKPRPDRPRLTSFVTQVGLEGAELLKYRASAQLIRAAARVSGLRAPKRVWIDADDALSIARWAENALKTSKRCRILANPSQAARIALAAIENSIDLTGTLFASTEEPATPGKVKLIYRSGASLTTFYAFAEGGAIGIGCANPSDPTDVHLMSDRFGLIQTPRSVPGIDITVDSFCLTTLSDSAPKILLNVEIDDFGVVEKRSCGCLLGDVGYDTHIREIYSFKKLTGEGVSLIGNDLIRILEEVLPQRFGGSSLDYQIVEEEEDEGLESVTKVSLIIDPRVEITDEQEVIDVLVEELEKTDKPSAMGGNIWAQLGTIRVKRMTPITTGGPRAKLLPLYVSRRAEAARRS